MRKALFVMLGLALVFGMVAVLQETPSVETPIALAQAGATYVGSDKCASCHRAIYDTFLSTGHPYKLRDAKDARAAGLPKPGYVSWDDILFVIGGFKWKARYVGQDGYIITQNKDGSIKGKNQFNIESEQFSDYNAGQKTAYNCGECHTTGYSKTGNQLGKEGLVGTWAFNGIQCEACHGPASQHTAGPSKANIKKETSALACAQCHRRGTLLNPDGSLHVDMTIIPVKSGPFIDHREQFQEMRVSKHANLNCVSCHNPHQRARLVKNTCATCHPSQVEAVKGSKHDKPGVSCEDCHMADAAQTAVRRGPFQGDLPSHLFKINTDVEAPFVTKVKITREGKEVEVETAAGYLTWQYACLQCHQGRDKAWAAQSIKGVHTLGK